MMERLYSLEQPYCNSELKLTHLEDRRMQADLAWMQMNLSQMHAEEPRVQPDLRLLRPEERRMRRCDLHRE